MCPGGGRTSERVQERLFVAVFHLKGPLELPRVGMKCDWHLFTLKPFPKGPESNRAHDQVQEMFWWGLLGSLMD